MVTKRVEVSVTAKPMANKDEPEMNISSITT